MAAPGSDGQGPLGAHRIGDLNPHRQVEVHDVMLTIDNALELIRPYDVVCDGTDNFLGMINDACVRLGKPLVYGSTNADGQVSCSTGAGRPNYRDLLPEPPPAGRFRPVRKPASGDCLDLWG